MTGIELKAYLLLFSIIVLLPAFAVSFLRILIGCDPRSTDDIEGRFMASISLFILLSVLTYFFLVFIYWDDRAYLGLLFGYPLPIALTIAAHVFIILIFSKIFSSLLPEPKSRIICPTYYLLLFISSTLLWTDLIHGLDSHFVNWLGGDALDSLD